MSIFKQAKSELSTGDNDKNYDCSEGFHQAVCTSMVDLGEIESNFNGEVKTQRKIQFYFAILDTADQTVKGLCSKRYTLSFHEKAALSGLLKDWRADVENLSQLIGKRATVYVEIDGKYTNLKSIVPAQGEVDIDLTDVFVPKFWYLDAEGNETGNDYISMDEVGRRPENEEENDD